MSLGDTCTCGDTAPPGSPVYSPTSSYACAGNSAESCGALGYGIVYKLSPRAPGASTMAYTSIPSGGQITTKVYTTTDGSGHTTVVTTTSSKPSAPPQGGTTHIYTTTDGSGHTTVITASSMYPTPPAPGGTTNIYTTTDGSGHTTIITTFSNNPITTPSTTLTGDETISAIAETTTDSQGHTVISTHTVLADLPVATAGGSGGSAGSGGSVSSLCPAVDGEYYRAGGSIYEISCSTDYPGDDLTSVHADTLPQCFLACSNYTPLQSVQGGKPCIAASWIQATGNCYLKYNIEVVNPFDGGVISGRQIHFVLPNGLRTVSASSYHIETSTSPPPPQSLGPSSAMGGGSGSTLVPPNPSSSATKGPSGASGSGGTAIPPSPSNSATQGPSGGNGSGSTTVPPNPSNSATQGPSGGNGSGSTPTPPGSSGSATQGPSGGSGSGGTPGPSGGSDSTSGGSGSPSTPALSPTNGGSSTSNSNTNPTNSPNFPCPSCDGQNYILSTNGDVYEVDCSVNYPGNDLLTQTLDNFNDCIFACDTLQGQQTCIAVTWEKSTGTCHLKSAITEVDYNAMGFDGARTGSYNIPSGIPSMASMSSAGSPQTIVSTYNGASGASDPTTSPGSPIASISVSPSSGSSRFIYTSSETMTYHPIATQASCPRNDFGLETDPLTVPYQINCDRDLAGNSLPSMHADNVDACLQGCDIFRGCAGVNYDDSTGGIPSSTNCYPFSSIQGYSKHALQNTTYAAIAAYGPNSAANGDDVSADYQDDICADADYGDQSTYTNIYGVSYYIRCGYGFSSSTNLVAMAADTLLACLSYCTLYDTCVGVTFSGNGPPAAGQTNCQPVSAYGTDLANPNLAYAVTQ